MFVNGHLHNVALRARMQILNESLDILSRLKTKRWHHKQVLKITC